MKTGSDCRWCSNPDVERHFAQSQADSSEPMANQPNRVLLVHGVGSSSIPISSAEPSPVQPKLTVISRNRPPTQFPRVVWLAALCTLRAVSSAGRTDRCRLALSIAESGPPLRLVQEVLLRATGPQTWCGCDVYVSTMYDVGR